ncbi:MAG: helix-turn-helix domain-containing protein [Lachnospiraceae bacterium]|nr:helix-turn-helix domain-containing protein [Lachnospiraceae bacterium]
MNTSYNDINQAATGARIREIRKARGLKVTDISNYMGFESPQAVYKWQRGDSLPDLGNMMRLLELFQIRDIREIVVMTGSADDALPFQLRLLWRR